MKRKKLLQPIKFFNFIEIHPSVVLLAAVAVWLRFVPQLLITYFIVAVHEAAHMIAASALGCKPEAVELLPFGITMRLRETTIRAPKNEIIIAAAGPLSNAVMALTALGLYHHALLSRDGALYIIAANTGIALVNLFPAMPLDGGRIFRSILTARIGHIRAMNVSLLVTRLTGVLLLAAGVAVVIISRFNFSLLLIGAFLIANAMSEQRAGKMLIMREIMLSRQKLAESGAQAAGLLTMTADTPAKAALKFFTYNRYYSIQIVDKDLRIIGTITETQLIEGLLRMGSGVTIQEIL